MLLQQNPSKINKKVDNACGNSLYMSIASMFLWQKRFWTSLRGIYMQFQPKSEETLWFLLSYLSWTHHRSIFKLCSMALIWHMHSMCISGLNQNYNHRKTQSDFYKEHCKSKPNAGMFSMHLRRKLPRFVEVWLLTISHKMYFLHPEDWRTFREIEHWYVGKWNLAGWRFLCASIICC